MENELKTSILLVDDRQENLIALSSLLEDLGENLVVARSGNDAIRKLLAQDFAVILLDVQMPGMSGFETASLVRSRGKWAATPIIFLTADSGNDARTFEGYRLGAVDFMYKPIVGDVLKAKVKVFVELAKKSELLRRHAERLQAEIEARQRLETAIKRSQASFRAMIEHAPDGIGVQRAGRLVYANPALARSLGLARSEQLVGALLSDLVSDVDRGRFEALIQRVEARGETGGEAEPPAELCLKREDGTALDVELAAISTVFNGEPSTLLMLRDVSERKQMQARLLELARTDHLTGLLVRRAGQEAIEREVVHAQRYAAPLSFVLFDVDHFKRINDRHGHAGGDAVLRAIGDVLRSSIRKCDVAVRWGGEELLALLPHTDEAGGRVFAERVRAGVEELELEHGLQATISAGVAQLDVRSTTEAAIGLADERLYRAKSEGRNRVR